MPVGPLPKLGGLGSFDDFDEFEGLGGEPDGPGPPAVDVPSVDVPSVDVSAVADPASDTGAGRSRPSPGGRRPAWIDGLPRPDELLEGLNDPQRHAVAYRGGPLLVVAGAGSGKTRVLTRRVAHLIATGDATPWEILAITFTNKAAAEMRDRLVDLIGPVAARMWVSTFHAACVRILRAHADRLGYRRSFTVYDDTDSRRLVEQIMRELNIDTKKLPPRSVQAAVSGAKAELVDFETYRAGAQTVFERRIGDVYAIYQQRLLAASAMDFDDLLMVTVNLLQSCDDVLESYRHRFRHVLVDEFQDTNRAQNELALLLAAEHRNICVVGDADQSIYGWRGADIRNILEFEEAFPDAAVIPLEENYRSTSTILDAANAVIANNTTRIPKELWTSGERGEKIRRYRAEDEYEEATWVASEITRLHATEHLRYGDIAVFFRTNALSRALEEELVRAAVPYKVVGGTRFYDRREVKDILAYLRVTVNPADEISARRIVNVPRRGVGATSVEKMAAWAAAGSRSFADAFVHLDEVGLAAKAARGVAELAELLDELRAGVAGGRGPADLLETVIERTGYRAELEAEDTVEARGRLENLGELAGAAADYDTVTEYLESVALVSDSDELDDDGTRVSLMTLHTAKGLEFPAVFLVGLEDGVFPHIRALDDPMQLEEERRLCYVGITRARRHLYLTHAWSRTQWGATSHAIPSRFLSEIPEEVVHDVGPSWRRRPDPLRPGTPYRVRRPRTGARRGGDDRSGGPGGDAGAESSDPWVDGDGDPNDGGDAWPDDGGDHDAWHDPDPWGDGAAAVTGRGTRRAGPPRKGRLPKMAEERFGLGQR